MKAFFWLVVLVLAFALVASKWWWVLPLVIAFLAGRLIRRRA